MTNKCTTRLVQHPSVTSPYKIERGVPIPTKRPILNKYPFYMMEVGDSFIVTEAKERTVVRSAAFEYGRIHSVKFKTRADGNATRVWRIA